MIIMIKVLNVRFGDFFQDVSIPYLKCYCFLILFSLYGDYKQRIILTDKTQNENFTETIF